MRKNGKQLNIGKGVTLVCNGNAELLRLVEATFDSKVAFLRRMRKKNLDKLIEKFVKRKVGNFLFYLFVVVDICVVKYQLKVFGKL